MSGLTYENALDLSRHMHDALASMSPRVMADFDPDLHGYAVDVEKAIGLMPKTAELGIHSALTSMPLGENNEQLWVLDMKWDLPGRAPGEMRFAHYDLLILLPESYILALAQRSESLDQKIIRP